MQLCKWRSPTLFWRKKKKKTPCFKWSRHGDGSTLFIKNNKKNHHVSSGRDMGMGQNYKKKKKKKTCFKWSRHGDGSKLFKTKKTPCFKWSRHGDGSKLFKQKKKRDMKTPRGVQPLVLFFQEPRGTRPKLRKAPMRLPRGVPVSQAHGLGAEKSEETSGKKKNTQKKERRRKEKRTSENNRSSWLIVHLLKLPTKNH